MMLALWLAALAIYQWPFLSFDLQFVSNEFSLWRPMVRIKRRFTLRNQLTIPLEKFPERAGVDVPAHGKSVRDNKVSKSSTRCCSVHWPQQISKSFSSELSDDFSVASLVLEILKLNHCLKVGVFIITNLSNPSRPQHPQNHQCHCLRKTRIVSAPFQGQGSSTPKI